MERVLEALLDPFLDPASRTYWAGLIGAVVVACTFMVLAGRTRDAGPALRAFTHRSSGLDLQLLVGRQLLRALGALPAFGGGWWLATWLVRVLDDGLGSPTWSMPGWAVTALYSVGLFVVWDLSRYVVHRVMHDVPALWEVHQIHHSAEVITPLTFHRVHPVESLLYGLREVVVTGVMAGLFFWAFRGQAVQWTVLGVHGGAFLANVTFGNLRHSHVWLGFGPLERWFLSPAQHQWHHAIDGDRENFGTWLAVWDRIGGSWAASGPVPPEAFGVRRRNHGDDLVSAWLGPLRAWVGAALGLLVASVAWSAEPEPEPTDDADDEAVYEIVVERGEVPRVAGSAHVVSEERLEQYEHDDIHAVLGEVPGVYVRGEDGFGLRPNIGIRGGNADRSAKVTLLEDGVLFAPAPYAAPAAYYFPMVTRMVGVEVFKGPASIQHGPHTIGGAVNLQTRGFPEGWDGAVDLAGGLRSTGKAHAWVGGGGKRWGLLLEGAGVSATGFKALDGGGPTGFARGELMAKARVATPLRAGRMTGIEAKVGLAREVSHETYLGLSVDDFAADPYRRYAASQLAQMAWDRSQLQLTWPLILGDIDIRTTGYHHRLERSWRKFNRFADGPDVHDLLLAQGDGGIVGVFKAILRGDEDSTTAGQVLQIGTNDRSFAASGVQTRARWEVEGASVASSLEAGLRVHHDQVDRLHTEEPHDMRDGVLVSAGPSTTTEDSRATATAFAAYVTDDLVFRDRVHVVPGLRMEHIEARYETETMTTTVVLPGLGVLVDLNDVVSAFLGTHRGFSPVSPSALGDRPAEMSWNLEAGVRVGWEGGRAEVVGFASDYDNLTAVCTTSSGCLDDLVAQQFDAGRAWVAGVEAVVAHELVLPAGWSVPVSATYTRTEAQFREGFTSSFPQWGAVAAGAALPYVPRDQASVHLGLTQQAAGVGVAWRGRGPMLDVAHRWPATSADIPALHTVDIEAHATLWGRFTAYAVATNVLNAAPVVSWRPLGARPPAPFQIMVGLKVAGTRDGP